MTIEANIFCCCLTTWGPVCLVGELDIAKRD
jgi:hypothetical protein